MSKLRLLTVFLMSHLLVLSGTAANNLTSDYYYYHGEKTAIEMNDSLLVLYYDSPETGKYLEEKYGLKPGRLEETDELGPVQISERLIKCVYEVRPSEYSTTLQSIRNEKNNVDVIRVAGKEHPVTITSSFSIYLSDNATEEEARNLAAELDVDFLGSCGWGRWYQLKTNRNSVGDALTCSNLFYESGICKEVDPGFGFRIVTNTVTDPGLVNQWAIDGVEIDINAQDAWNMTKGKSNIKVAILDEGIRIDHPEFSTTNFVSYYDAHNRTEQHNLFGHHGTKVTGVISSNHNSDSIAGVAPNLSILEVSAQISNNLVYMVNDVDSLTIAESMSNGIAWAVHNGADVLNCSWKASETNFHSVRLESSIDSALYFGRGGKGCVVIFSSGNIESGHNNSYKDSIAYPANFNPDILVVGAVNQNGSRSTISKYGSQLDLVAPGEDILTTDFDDGSSNPVCWRREYGTSMAAPFVSAVAGLILSESPDMTREEVVELLCRTTQKINYSSDYNKTREYGSWCIEKGYGMVDALHAIYMEYSDMNCSNEDFIIGCNVRLFDYNNQTEKETVVKGYSSITADGFFYIGPGGELYFNSYPDIQPYINIAHF